MKVQTDSLYPIKRDVLIVSTEQKIYASSAAFYLIEIDLFSASMIIYYFISNMLVICD